MFSTDDYRTAEEFLMLYCPKPDSVITGALPPDWEERTDKRDMDIVIPCYNVEQYAEQCLDSIVPHPFRENVGIFLVDDGSTDRTGEILESYRRFTHVTVIHQENRGLSEARNAGIRLSNSRFLFFIDSDDYVVPEHVEEMLVFAMKNEADSVRGVTYNVFEGEEIKPPAEEETGVFEEIPPLDATAYAWGTVLNAGLFKELCYPGGYLFEDVLMHLVMSPLCKKSYLYHRSSYAYRMNPEGITAKSQFQPKAVHSFWILYPMLDTIEKMQIPLESGLYNKILAHIAQTHIRIAKLEDNVKVAVFIATCGRMKEINHTRTTDDQYRALLQKAMLAEDYSLYDQACRLVFEALRVGR